MLRRFAPRNDTPQLAGYFGDGALSFELWTLNFRRWEIVLLAAILLVAAFFRLYRLEAAPPGLQHDEVFHGHDASVVLQGAHRIYFESNAGNEPLFVYLVAGTIALFGANYLGIRLAAVLCGLATIIFTYLLARKAFGYRVALMASAGLAVSFWPVFMSRVGLRAASLPPMAAAAAYFFWAGLKQPKVGRRWWAYFTLAGIFLGGTLYTYPASRTIPLIFLLFAGYLALFNRPLLRPNCYQGASPPRLRAGWPRGEDAPPQQSERSKELLPTCLEQWRGILLCFTLTTLVVAPMGVYIWTHPQADARLQQLNQPLGLLAQGDPSQVIRFTLDTLKMFTFRGDPVWRYNLAGRPVFEPISGALFYLGLALALLRWRQPRYAFLLLWLPLGLAPSMITDCAPSFLRASGALPVVYIFPALAIEVAWRWLEGRFGKRAVYGLAAALLLLLASNAWWTYRDYFTVWASTRPIWPRPPAIWTKATSLTPSACPPPTPTI